MLLINLHNYVCKFVQVDLDVLWVLRWSQEEQLCSSGEATVKYVQRYAAYV